MTKWLFVFLLFVSTGHAELLLPSGLSGPDRERIVSILGPGTIMKVLGDPYPLGGYSGVEVGVSGIILDTKDLSTLGSKAATQSGTSYMAISVAKGLFHNVDLAVDFSPLEQPDGISYFSGQVRWGLHQGKRLPIYWSAIVSVGGGTFKNTLGINSQEMDLVAGFRESDVVLYIGSGYFKAQGLFSDGEKSAVAHPHYFTGLSIDVAQAFIALQLDQYTQPFYSAKLGFRF